VLCKPTPSLLRVSLGSSSLFFLATFIIVIIIIRASAAAAAARACPEASACNDESFEESDVIFQGRESNNNLIAKLLAAEGLAPSRRGSGATVITDLGQAPGREDKEAAGVGPGASSCPVEDKEGPGVAGELLFLAYLGATGMVLAPSGRFFGPATGLTGRRVERGGGSSSRGISSISSSAAGRAVPAGGTATSSLGSSTIGVTVIGRTGIAGIGPGRNPGGPIIEGPIIVEAAAGGPISCMPGGIPAIMRGGLACHCDIMCICGGNIGIPGCHGAAAAAARTWLWCSSSCRTSKRPWVRCNRARRPAMARGGDVTTGETGELQKIF